ncbi:hypothetical protein HU200_044667 [Digitaria exilis]|uniref:Uncharacterized protein n=1 Tax=Digitaria exilis TaxID=1010633 RepID=A0A835EGE2_9POAL|nr:hypothetical protein HU200_044667 [Digitaria exilis]
MCPRATAAQQHCGAAMASVCSFVEEEYIDLDLSSCGEFEFRVRRSCGAADELLLCRGRLSASAPPPHKAAPRPAGKVQEVDVGCGGAGAGRRSAATVAPLQHSHSAAGFRDAHPSPVVRLRKEGSRRRKAAATARSVHAKLLASRAFFRSLFARTSCSDEQCRGGADVRRSRSATAPPSGDAKSGGGCKAPFGQIKSSSGRAAPAPPTTLRSSIEQEKLLDEEELAAATAAVRQRKSFSGVIKWRHATATTAPTAAAPAKPLSSSSSARRSSWAGGGGGPALKRSSSARSESEGLIQGAIAYCKRSQQQLGLARKSVSDASLCSAPSWHGSNPARSAVVLAYCH